MKANLFKLFVVSVKKTGERTQVYYMDIDEICIPDKTLSFRLNILVLNLFLVKKGNFSLQNFRPNHF